LDHLLSAKPKSYQTSPPLIAAVNQSAMNIANSLGAALGGLVIAGGWGYIAPAWVGVALGVVGLSLAAVSFLVEDRARPAAASIPVAVR